jgi:hypothetical protein
MTTRTDAEQAAIKEIVDGCKMIADRAVVMGARADAMAREKPSKKPHQTPLPENRLDEPRGDAKAGNPNHDPSDGKFSSGGGSGSKGKKETNKNFDRIGGQLLEATGKKYISGKDIPEMESLIKEAKSHVASNPSDKEYFERDIKSLEKKISEHHAEMKKAKSGK